MRSHCLFAAVLCLLASLPSTSGAASRVLDDFEDGDLVADAGLAWIPLTDEQFGGSSRTALQIVDSPDSRGAMRILGRALRGDSPFAFAGCWLALGPHGAPCDLTGFDRVRFRVRGDGIPLQVGIRRGAPGEMQYNFMANVAPSGDWTTVEIPFRDLVAQPPAPPGAVCEPTHAWYLGFANAPKSEGDFSMEIDDVELAGPGTAPASAPSDGGVYAAIVDLEPANSVRDFPWRLLGEEAAGDARWPRLPDARSLWYHYDRHEDRIWFRVQLPDDVPDDWFGFNVAVDADRDQSNGSPWWGTNRGFRWDRLVSAYLFRVGPRWQGTVGVADSAGVARGEMTSLASAGVVAGADREGRALFVGVPRASIDDDLDMNVIATVGSAMAANDDLPNEGHLALPPRLREQW